MKTLKYVSMMGLALTLCACLFELKYSVGGTVTGLRGSGLVLTDNSGKGLGVAANGAFAFSSKLTKGSTYSVTVATQPSKPAQTCTVRNGTGTIARVDVTDIIVTCTQAGRYAYVANTQANTIAAFAIDSSNGFLSPVAGSPFPAIGSAPTALAVDPNGIYLYSTNSSSNTVSVHTISDATGALNPANSTIPTGLGPTGLVVDPSGHHLYVANSGGNTVSAFTVQNGIATPIGGAPYAVGRQPTALAVDDSGQFLLVVNAADGDVSVFTIDAATGELSAVSGSPFAAGASPQSVAIDPAGAFAYVANATGASITTYSITPITGVLGAVTGPPLATSSAPQALVVDPAGKYLYAANVTSNNDIASYVIAPVTGALTLSSTSGAGTVPRGIAVDKAGTFVYSADSQSGTVSVFSVDSATGALTAVTGSPFASGTGARSVAID